MGSPKSGVSGQRESQNAVCEPIPGYKVTVSPEKVAPIAILGNFALKIREPIDRVYIVDIGLIMQPG